MASRKEIESFSPDMLVDHLSVVLDGEISNNALEEIRRNKISGRTFLELKEEDLKELASLLGERKALMRVIQSYKVTTVAPVSGSNYTSV